ANTLNPVIPPANSLKWADVFKNVSITSDENIPINKRGSGSKRLILLNFFRAEVERRQNDINATSVIYAIEEPETSQHSENQKKLIQALIALANAANTQVIITTHSATIVKELGFNNIRIIRMEENQKVVENTLPNQLPYPSLNEVNYLAFSEISEEYHNELYGYIEEQGLLDEYKQGKPTVQYTRALRGGATRVEQITQTEYIRHQIHHPENTHNVRFSDEDLRTSIDMMRTFIQTQN
ncbi:MAG: AAA family ATPase, partial [Emergencia sp.]